MLTIFSIPKTFHGNIDTIQRNAIESWTLLEPKCEIILLGDDAGTDIAARDLGVKHIAGVNRNEFGTPLLDHAFELASAESEYPLICYVNADIILMNDLTEAVAKVSAQTSSFLMTAQRWNLDIENRLDFGVGWQANLLQDLSSRGHLNHYTGIDFWVYQKELLSGMPPLAVGRIAFDSWCLYKARAMGADLIDATQMVVSVHQNHDYSHHPDGEIGIGTGIEAQRNRELVGGKPYFFIIKDRTHILTQNGLKVSRDAWRVWRFIRTSQVLNITFPKPVKAMVQTLNYVIDITRDSLILAKRAFKSVKTQI